jgi:hypothetical protein
VPATVSHTKNLSTHRKKTKNKKAKNKKIYKKLNKIIIYNYGLHEKLISIIIKSRKGYFPEVRRTE